MLVAVLILQIVTVALLVWFLRPKATTTLSAADEPTVAEVPATPGVRTDLAARYRSGPGGWHLDGHVEIDSPAYLHALNTRGFAVQRPGEDIDPGVQ